jgi:hypothetical protein
VIFIRFAEAKASAGYGPVQRCDRGFHSLEEGIDFVLVVAAFSDRRPTENWLAHIIRRQPVVRTGDA